MAAAEQTVLILGGTSDIARATALAFAQNHWTVRLAGRALPELQREADDILRPAPAARSPFTGLTRLTTPSFAEFIDALPGLPDVVISVVGLLGEQTPRRIRPRSRQGNHALELRGPGV